MVKRYSFFLRLAHRLAGAQRACQQAAVPRSARRTAHVHAAVGRHHPFGRQLLLCPMGIKLKRKCFIYLPYCSKLRAHFYFSDPFARGLIL